MSLDQEKDAPSNSMVDEKSSEQQWAQLWVLHLFAHQRRGCRESSLFSVQATKILT